MPLFWSISKDVKFPLMLDVYELCTAEVQEKMGPVRSKFKVVEDKNLERAQQKVCIYRSAQIITLHFSRCSTFDSDRDVVLFPILNCYI